MNGVQATIMFNDPPYNVPIDGHVSGLGRFKHREFEVAAGEMDEAAFTEFLHQTHVAATTQLKDGAIALVCMDWRHMREVLCAGHDVFDELKNLCVWNKTTGGMGTFYRSKHEMVFVFKKGKAAHINNFGLGDTGRYRRMSGTIRRSVRLVLRATKNFQSIQQSSPLPWPRMQSVIVRAVVTRSLMCLVVLSRP